MDAADGLADEVAGDGVTATELTFVFEFDLTGDGREGGVEIGDARHGHVITGAQGAAFGIRDYVFEYGDGKALADSGTLVDLLVFASEEGDLFDDFADVFGDADLHVGGVAGGPGFLGCDGDAMFHSERIMGANFAANAVF